MINLPCCYKNMTTYLFVSQTRPPSSRQRRSGSSSSWSRWWTWGTPWCCSWRRRGWRRWARSRRPSPSGRPNATRRRELRFTGNKAFTHTYTQHDGWMWDLLLSDLEPETFEKPKMRPNRWGGWPTTSTPSLSKRRIKSFGLKGPQAEWI